MLNVHLPGVYIYGALTVVMLFLANLLSLNTGGALAAIVCSGAAYFASVGGCLSMDRLCNILWCVSVFAGVLSLAALIV
ncbi:hypothetical protein [Roseibium sediminis]|uniref:hypothetical protein n=1 Tax=Roseibium sediminis TaxID=1775174 RepID=UPI00123DC87D|nr:hypothetical protein [Roseibium sediminis]